MAERFAFSGGRIARWFVEEVFGPGIACLVQLPPASSETKVTALYFDQRIIQWQERWATLDSKICEVALMSPEVKESCEDAARLVAAITPEAELGTVSRHMALMGATGGPYAPRVVAANDVTGIAKHVRAAWATAGKANAYFTPNPVLEGCIKTKPNKSEITSIAAVMVDLDPPKASRPAEGDAKGWAAARAQMLALGQLVAGLPPEVRPTATVFSGNGLQLHYKLAQPLDAAATAAADAMEMRWRDQVLRPLGADKTQNRDRLARLPGPNIKSGRPDGCATLIDADPSRTYGPEDFPRIRDALLELPGWPAPAATEKQTRADPPAAPQAGVEKPGPMTEDGAGAQGAGIEGERIEAGIKALLPMLGELRGKDRTTLSPQASDMMLGSRTVLRRLRGDTSGLPDGSGSAVLQSLAGAVKAKEGSMEVFAELAFACDLSRGHLDRQPDDRMTARAVARAWVTRRNRSSVARLRSAAAMDETRWPASLPPGTTGIFSTTTAAAGGLRGPGTAGRRTRRACTSKRAAGWPRSWRGPPASGRPPSATAGSRARSPSRPTTRSWRQPKTTSTATPICWACQAPPLTCGRDRRGRPTRQIRISRQTVIAPAETAQCPNWLAFLAEATGGDQDMIRFLQCWLRLRPDGRHEGAEVRYGAWPRRDGKGTAVDTVYHLMGGYAEVVEMDALLASSGQRHPTDLAGLLGARMVTAAETERGRRWNEARIKRLTGGDPIPARFMRQDFFTFTPEFKLTVTGNHAPLVDATDDALRRRLIVVPFTQKPRQADHGLREKLKLEWPGILRWMIDGALLWQRIGLTPPAAANRATDDVFGAGDLLGRFLGDECDTAPGNDGLWCPTAGLYSKFSDYARAAGEIPGTQRDFTDSLKKRGFENTRKNQGRGWSGIQLREHGPAETADHTDCGSDDARQFVKAPILQ